MTVPYTEQYSGLYATPELVGRKPLLEQFKRILSDPSKAPKLVFLHGPGGIGKTRLLKKILEMGRALPNGRGAEDVLDFYHIMSHTPIGLANAIFELLTPPFDCFQIYQPAHDALNRARLRGNVMELEKMREDTLNIFDQDLKQLSSISRVVLALDTAERLVYGLPGWTDEIPLAESWNWLTERLGEWQNVVIFIAGQTEARPAIERLKAKHPALVEEIEVTPFSEVESLNYFEKVAQLLKKEGEYQLGERLENFPENFKRGAHAYAQGRPILLSLLVDYLSFPGVSDVPHILQQSPPQPLTDKDTHRFENALLARLREGEIGETLIVLGRAPKGTDEELLAALLGVSGFEARKRLENVKRLSVVKIRPQDQRVFLHDEMYALLQRHVFNSPHDVEPQKNAFETIKQYYQVQRDACIKRLAELYAPVEEEGRENLDLERITQTDAARQTILSEMMFYFLRHDFERGFRHYYRYSQEAIYSNDILMDMHLQAEMLDFLVQLPDETVKLQVQGEFSPQMLLATLRLRSIMRSWAESKYKEAFEGADYLLRQVESSWKDSFPAVLAALHTWAAQSRVMRGMGDDLAKANKHLDMAFSLFPDEITKTLQSVEEISEQSSGKYSLTEVWYMRAILALAYRIRGYLFRVQGYPQQAIDNNRHSIELLKILDIRVELATALNDISFALATQGKWQDGRSLARDAIELRRELGHRLPVALSLSTLAMIDIYEGQYNSAQDNAERALAIFRARYDNRGKGLALIALSESRRRYAITTPLLEAERRIELIRQARDHANEAKTIFSQNIEEPSRKVEALIELGCACRDWVRLRGEYPNPKDNIRRLIAEGEDALLQAFDIAHKEDIRYRAIDALVNLAWLRYYILEKEDSEVFDQEQLLSQAIQQAHQSIPSEYFFVAGKAVLEHANAQIEIWPQLGKLYLLEGHLEYYRLEKIPKEERKKYTSSGEGKHVRGLLGKLTEKYAESLEYSALYERDYRGIRGGKDQIYGKLKKLNEVERRAICRKIRDLYPSGDSVIEGLLQDRVLWLD